MLLATAVAACTATCYIDTVAKRQMRYCPTAQSPSSCAGQGIVVSVSAGVSIWSNFKKARGYLSPPPRFTPALLVRVRSRIASRHFIALSIFCYTVLTMCFALLQRFLARALQPFVSRGWCQDKCGRMGKKLAGLEAGHACFCDDTLATPTATVAEAQCNTTCIADVMETCGGIYRLEVRLDH